MILLGGYDLLFEFLYEASKYIITLLAVILAIYLGSRLRKHHDSKKSMNTLHAQSEESDDITTE